MEKELGNSGKHIIGQNKEILEYLKDSRLFAPFPRKYIEKLVPISKLVEIPKGEIILKEGEINSRVYFLIRGEVSLYSGGEHILNLRRKGDIFGESSVIADLPSLNTVVAEMPVRVFYIESQHIESVTEISTDEFHNFLYRLFAIIMTDKLALTNHKAQHYEITQKRLLKEIKEHKQAKQELKESEEKYRELVQSSNSVIMKFDPEFKITFINRFARDFFGYSENEIIGKSMIGTVVPESESTGRDLKKVMEKVFDNPKAYADNENENLRKSGERVWVAWRNKGIYDNNGRFSGMLCMGYDITKRKQAEDQIKGALQEKETLLREIHHRVKNNMQVINSLLKLQSNYIEDPQAKSILKDCQSRVYAMSAIHETLHGSEKLSEINLKSYLSKITKTIFQTYLPDQSRVKLSCDIKNSPISINQASPLGLIINELLSNALKYAFPDDRAGEITVRMQKPENNKLELCVSDNGVGISKDIDWKNTRSLGLRLVRTLVEDQLEGSINMKNENGTQFIINFNKAQP
ncbi:PAS domain S-box protein [bacterium]|nr:PAS domain S-box protein [bacterium]